MLRRTPLARSSLPLRGTPRTPLRPQRAKLYVAPPWKPQRIRLDARGMAELRHQKFYEAKGYCQICGVRAGWWQGELAHILARAKGGSDTLQNTLWLCRGCHKKIDGNVLHWSPKAEKPA